MKLCVVTIPEFYCIRFLEFLKKIIYGEISFFRLVSNPNRFPVYFQMNLKKCKYNQFLLNLAINKTPFLLVYYQHIVGIMILTIY